MCTRHSPKPDHDRPVTPVPGGSSFRVCRLFGKETTGCRAGAAIPSLSLLSSPFFSFLNLSLYSVLSINLSTLSPIFLTESYFLLRQDVCYQAY